MSAARSRPPWWPDGEEWPPPNWRGGHRGGPWRYRGGPPLFFRFGCAIFFFALFVLVAISALVWVIGGLMGGVQSPPTGNGLLIGLVIGAAVAALLAFRALRRLSAPLDELADAAERIERGDYSARVTPSGPPRMRSLARAFNDMSERLAAVDEGRRAFLAEAAHELRTPLSVISGQIEAIEDGLYPADAEHLAPIREQLRTLEQLIEDMRTVALAEAGALSLKIQPTDVGVSIDHAVAAFQADAAGAGVTLAADYPLGLPRATADEQRLGQVLANLISNALRRHIARRPRDGRGSRRAGRSMRRRAVMMVGAVPRSSTPTAVFRREGLVALVRRLRRRAACRAVPLDVGGGEEMRAWGAAAALGDGDASSGRRGGGGALPSTMVRRP